MNLIILKKLITCTLSFESFKVLSLGLVAEIECMEIFDVGIFSGSKNANNSLYHTLVYK